MWLPDFDRHDDGAIGGGAYHPAYAWRLVIHMTQGSTTGGAVAAYRKHNSWPHATVDPIIRQRVQHLPLDRAARALKNTSGGVETNRARAIQVEVVGFSERAHEMPADQADWIGREVIRPIARLLPVRLEAPPFYGADAGWTLAVATARQRMSTDTWIGFSGICGHQHIPENDHWDPGRIDIARILAAAASPRPAGTITYRPPVEVDMKVRQLELAWPTDPEGRGNWRIPYPINRVLAVLPHSEVRPNVDGRYDTTPNSVTVSPDGDHTVIVWQGHNPDWPAHVWVNVIEEA